MFILKVHLFHFKGVLHVGPNSAPTISWSQADQSVEKPASKYSIPHAVPPQGKLSITEVAIKPTG